MSINLQKGQKIDLTKSAPGLERIMVGLGWDEARSKGINLFRSEKKQDIDCDASVILLDQNDRLYGPDLKSHLVYFGNLVHESGAIEHKGDNLTGAGEGDDEQIMVTLKKVPAEVAKLVFVVNIYDANTRNQHFGMIENAFIRLVDLGKGTEICRFNLSENYDGMTGMIVGEIYRRGGEWKFNAVGQPVKQASRLMQILDRYK